jgi:hypothetical protein
MGAGRPGCGVASTFPQRLDFGDQPGERKHVDVLTQGVAL